MPSILRFGEGCSREKSSSSSESSDRNPPTAFCFRDSVGFEGKERLTAGREESSGYAMGEDAILRTGGEETVVWRFSRDRSGVSGNKLAFNEFPCE